MEKICTIPDLKVYPRKLRDILLESGWKPSGGFTGDGGIIVAEEWTHHELPGASYDDIAAIRLWIKYLEEL